LISFGNLVSSLTARTLSHSWIVLSEAVRVFLLPLPLVHLLVNMSSTGSSPLVQSTHRGSPLTSANENGSSKVQRVLSLLFCSVPVDVAFFYLRYVCIICPGYRIFISNVPSRDT
jgi:hypothetical protein